MPTQYPELNALLADLVASARDILGEDLVGFYLVGSLAVGHADSHSDCDFIAVMRQPVKPNQEEGLRALHDDIPTRQGSWAKNLEGSYAPIDHLRTLGALGQDWLYIDHGWREMQWSTHCNSLEHRWALRERGVVLVGPEPATFAARVPAEDLSAAMAERLPSLFDDLATWVDIDSLAWGQRYAVVTLCRMFRSYVDGQVHSKAASLDWAMGHFGEKWTPLLQQVKADRALGWDPDAHPHRASIEQTRAFARVVLSRVTPP